MIYIYGAGGHGKVVFHTFASSGHSVAAFIDDKASEKFCGLPIINSQLLSASESHTIHFAIGDNRIRSELQNKWDKAGIRAETVIHGNAVVYSETGIGYGCLVAAGSIVGPGAVIGNGTIINHNSVVDHDCSIGDFCHIAPSATLGGGVEIGNQSLVGANATILPTRKIGSRVVIGAGAVVISDVPNDSVVVGCPAQPLK